MDYVDVRGVWPMYVRGQVAITLVGKPHTITVADARAAAQQLMNSAVTTPAVER